MIANIAVKANKQERKREGRGESERKGLVQIPQLLSNVVEKKLILRSEKYIQFIK